MTDDKLNEVIARMYPAPPVKRITDAMVLDAAAVLLIAPPDMDVITVARAVLNAALTAGDEHD